jgi:hypothetical protein
VVFWSYGRSDFSSLLDVEAKDELNGVDAKVARKSALANIWTKRKTRRTGLSQDSVEGHWYSLEVGSFV